MRRCTIKQAYPGKNWVYRSCTLPRPCVMPNGENRSSCLCMHIIQHHSLFSNALYMWMLHNLFHDEVRFLFDGWELRLHQLLKELGFGNSQMQQEWAYFVGFRRHNHFNTLCEFFYVFLLTRRRRTILLLFEYLSLNVIIYGYLGLLHCLLKYLQSTCDHIL